MALQSVDHETRLSSDDHLALRLWLRLLTCSNLIETSIRRRLQQDFDLTLPRFDLLAQLDRADGLKMSELSRRLMVTSGNVTGIADQLERDGWLTRESDSGDRRATRLRLTDSGRKRFSAMARVIMSSTVNVARFGWLLFKRSGDIVASSPVQFKPSENEKDCCDQSKGRRRGTHLRPCIAQS